MLCWGDNSQKQLGTNTPPSPVPLTPSLLAMIAAGDHHACVLRTDGQVWCFGANVAGQLGVSNSTDGVPVQVPIAGDGLTAITSWATYNCAVRAASNIAWCWGNNVAKPPPSVPLNINCP